MGLSVRQRVCLYINLSALAVSAVLCRSVTVSVRLFLYLSVCMFYQMRPRKSQTDRPTDDNSKDSQAETTATKLRPLYNNNDYYDYYDT